MLLSKVLNDFYVLPLGQSEIVGYHRDEEQIQIDWCDSETLEPHFQQFEDQEIQENTVIVRGAFNVTTIEGEVVTFIALDGATLKPERLLVHLDGGLVQAVLSERTSYEVIIIDYDTAGADDDEIAEIPQTDGGTEMQAIARVDTTVVDAKFIDGAFRSIN